VEKLYVVECMDDNNPTVLGALEKQEDIFVYTPTENAKTSVFKWTLEPFTKKHLPPYINLRIPGPHKISLPKILKKYGLNNYDEWELLKATRGFSAKDSLTFEYNVGLEEIFKAVKPIHEPTHNNETNPLFARKNYKKVYSRSAMLRNLQYNLSSNEYKKVFPLHTPAKTNEQFNMTDGVLRKRGVVLISASNKLNEVLVKHNTIIKGIGEERSDLAGIEKWKIIKKSLEEQAAGIQAGIRPVKIRSSNRTLNAPNQLIDTRVEATSKLNQIRKASQQMKCIDDVSRNTDI
jgi:hypothetical protein